MHDDELHRFKSDIHFLQYAADRYGYLRDRRESSVSSHVLRHPATDDKIVVRKDRDGHWTYFSVRDDRDHGTIVDFVQRRGRHRFARVRPRGAPQWLGTARPVPEPSSAPTRRRPRRAGPWPRSLRPRASPPRAPTSTREAFAGRPCPTRASPAPGAWIARGNVLFAHRDEAGAVTGFEIKSRGFTGFAAGGTKTRLAERGPRRAIACSSSPRAPSTRSATTSFIAAAAKPPATSAPRARPAPRRCELLEKVFSRLPRGGHRGRRRRLRRGRPQDRRAHRDADASRAPPWLPRRRPRRSEGLERRPSARRARLHPVAADRAACSRRSRAMTPAA